MILILLLLGEHALHCIFMEAFSFPSLIILLLLSLPLYEPRNIMATVVILSLSDIPAHDVPSTTSEYDGDAQPATL